MLLESSTHSPVGKAQVGMGAEVGLRRTLQTLAVSAMRSMVLLTILLLPMRRVTLLDIPIC
jgi:hypothetical protein